MESPNPGRDPTHRCAQVQPEILQSVDLEDVESALRGCLLKLQYANASLGPLKKGNLSSPFLSITSAVTSALGAAGYCLASHRL